MVYELLSMKKESSCRLYGNANETVVLIKPLSSQTYRNVVDALDEMQINQVNLLYLDGCRQGGTGQCFETKR